jgi:protein-disulfide isomerase
MTEVKLNADPLVWGHGPKEFAMFLEPTCPFSAKAFGKIDELLAKAGADKISVKVHLHSQPWHMYSGVITRAILAASTLDGGKETARAVMNAIYARRDDYEFEDHAGGSNMDATPNQIIERIKQHSDVDVAEAFAIPALTQPVKNHTRFARQNGIHVSPTFMVDGLIAPSIGSGDEVESWMEELGLS